MSDGGDKGGDGVIGSWLRASGRLNTPLAGVIVLTGVWYFLGRIAAATEWSSSAQIAFFGVALGFVGFITVSYFILVIRYADDLVLTSRERLALKLLDVGRKVGTEYELSLEEEKGEGEDCAAAD